MSEQLTYVLDSMEKLIGGTRADQLSNATPCEKWTVRDLINHFVGGGHMFAMLYRGEPMPDMHGPVPDMVGPDPASSAHAARTDFDAALAEPGVMERTVHLPIGSVPAPVGLQIATFDVLVHCWDLATATGQQFEPPAGLVSAAQGYAQQLLPVAARDGDTFKDEVIPRADATPLEKLAAFTGRSV
jgi:uncharacterized protein (TIGR03086 family)